MKILFITNSLSRTGAPIVLLNLLIWIKNNYSSVKIDIISLESGELERKFKENSNSLFIYKNNIFQKIIMYLFKSKSINLIKFNKILLFKKKKYDLIYLNTVVTLPIAYTIFNKNNKIILHVHELDYVIKKHVPNFKKYLSIINYYIAVSQLVKDNLCINYEINHEYVEVIYPPSKIKLNNNIFAKKQNFIIGGSGEVRWQKGADIFIALAKYVKTYFPEYNISFIWVGRISSIERVKIKHDLEKSNIHSSVKFIGEKVSPHEFFNNFDVFVLTSREDPFPLVCIEAGMLAKPIICFKNATGIQEILINGGGYVVPYLDIKKMAEKIIFYNDNRDILKHDGLKSRELFYEFTPDKIYPQIFNLIKKYIK